MKLFIEGHKYNDEASKSLLKKLLIFEQGGSYSTDMVGYYYSHDVQDTVFFLPKVVLDRDNKVFHKCSPEKIIDLQAALENDYISDDEYRFVYGLSVWIYRAITVFRNTADDQHKKILLYRDIPSDSLSGRSVYNTFLDILISLQRFNEANQHFFTFYLRDIHSGFNKINWTKTITHSQAFIQDDIPIYLDVVNRKKKVNLDEELFIIFFSILRHMQNKYGFPVIINFNFPHIADDIFENYLNGYGELRLCQIRHRYFSDKLVQMWHLCYDFFSNQSHIQDNILYSDYLLAKDFNIVFEEMIDHLLAEKDKRVDKMKLKDQTDGKRVDHIYAWTGLMHEDEDIFYIGDSKYYKQKNDPKEYSVYKQFTYARNVIQANLDFFNAENSKGKKMYKLDDDYLVYRDDATEGYNITPNFFIRAHIPEDRSYENDDLKKQGKMERVLHFENRLFDRDTLLLQHYDINFLYVLATYGSEDILSQETFKLKARKLFREQIITDIQNKYCFFSLQLKQIKGISNKEVCYSIERMIQLVEQKYFRKLLGKLFMPNKDEPLLLLALESDAKFLNENIQLLSDLSKDFYIRHYALGTDPRNTINKFVDSANESSNKFQFDDYNDEVFLLGSYIDCENNQLEWIQKQMMYSVRTSILQRYREKGRIDNKIVSARFLVLFSINEKQDCHIYKIKSWEIRPIEWMKLNGYGEIDEPCIVYNLSAEIATENLILNTLDEVFSSLPVFLTGKQISGYALQVRTN